MSTSRSCERSLSFRRDYVSLDPEVDILAPSGRSLSFRRESDSSNAGADLYSKSEERIGARVTITGYNGGAFTVEIFPGNKVETLLGQLELITGIKRSHIKLVSGKLLLPGIRLDYYGLDSNSIIQMSLRDFGGTSRPKSSGPNSSSSVRSISAVRVAPVRRSTAAPITMVTPGQPTVDISTPLPLV